MRPKSIVLFDRLFLASLIIGVINAVLSFDSMQAELAANPDTAALGWGPGMVVAVIAFSLMIPLLLWYLVAYRASGTAKWILVVLTVGGLLFVSIDLQNLLSLANIGTVVVTVLQLVAIALLFSPDAKAWFDHGPGDNPDDRQGVTLR